MNTPRLTTPLLLLAIVVLLSVIVYLMITDEPDRAPVQLVQQVATTDTLRPSEFDGRPAFNTIARSVTPSVVFIESRVLRRRMEMPDDEIHNNQRNQEEWDRFLPGRRTSVAGSGVILSNDGYILTNHHVVSDAIKGGVSVTLYDKQTFKARIVGTDPNTDLAILKIDADSLTPVTIGNSDQVRVGDWVLAVGNPFRLKSTVTAGIVSALGRNMDIIDTPLRVESFIQTDAAINQGNSGGALIDANGTLIGINTAIATQTGVYEGYGFAIPINMAIKIAKDLIEFGEVQRAFLGVEIQSLSFDRAKSLGMKDAQGVEVSRVIKNGSAYKAGIKKYDVIVEVNGMRVNEAHELQARVAMVRPGDKVLLSVWSEGKMRRVTVNVVGNEDQSVQDLFRGFEF
jgi:Do/DeqQ family serine protease